MKNLNHFKQLLEAEKELDYSKLTKLTVTGPDGKKVIHKTSENSKTVEDAKSEEDEENSINNSPKLKIEQNKPKKDSKNDSKDLETKKED